MLKLVISYEISLKIRPIINKSWLFYTSVFIVDGDTYLVPGRIIDEDGDMKLIFVDGYQQSVDAPANIKWERIGAFPNPIV